MWLLLLEAGLAVSLLIFIVWWTMISGKKPDHSQPRQSPRKDDQTD